MIDLPKTLQFLRPNASWHLLGDDYEGLTWADSVQIKPTWDEIVAAQPALQSFEIDERRKEAYRLEADPIFFQWQRGEKARSDWDNAVARVRARFPDPRSSSSSGGADISSSSK